MPLAVFTLSTEDAPPSQVALKPIAAIKHLPRLRELMTNLIEPDYTRLLHLRTGPMLRWLQA
jgi:hypothetical protein